MVGSARLSFSRPSERVPNVCLAVRDDSPLTSLHSVLNVPGTSSTPDSVLGNSDNSKSQTKIRTSVVGEARPASEVLVAQKGYSTDVLLCMWLLQVFHRMQSRLDVFWGK